MWSSVDDRPATGCSPSLRTDRKQQPESAGAGPRAERAGLAGPSAHNEAASLPNVTLAYLALALGVLSLGFSAIFVQWAEAPGITSSFYRMAIASMLLGLPFLIRLKRPPRSAIRIALLGGLLFGADLAAWATGVRLSNALDPTLLANTAPIWVGLGALLFFRERLRLGFWLGVGLAIGGAALVVGVTASGSTVGQLLGLLAGVFYAGYFLVTQRGRLRLDALSYFWLYTAGSAITLGLLALLTRTPLTGFPPRSYAVFLLMAVVTQTIGYFSISYALGVLPASLVSPTLLGQPVITAALSGPLLGELLSPQQLVGAAAVVLGVLIVHRTRIPTLPAPRTPAAAD